MEQIQVDKEYGSATADIAGLLTILAIAQTRPHKFEPGCGKPSCDPKLSEMLQFWTDSKEKLPAFVEACRTKFAEERSGEKYKWAQIQAECTRAQPERARALLLDWTLAALPIQVAKVEKDVQKGVRSMQGSAQFEQVHFYYHYDRLRAELVQALDPVYKAAGQTMPDDLLAGLDKTQKELVAAMDARVRKEKFPSKGEMKDAAVEAAVREHVEKSKGTEVGLFRTVKSNERPYTVEKVLLSKWTVHVNALGVPFCRTAGWEVLTKSKGEKYCRGFAGEVRQEYAGGKKYNPQNTVSTPLAYRKGTRLYPCE